MICASTVDSHMVYTRIVSSSTQSNSVIANKSGGFYDPNSDTNYGIRAIFVKDINNVRSLIYDKSTGLSYLALIDFSIP